MYIYFSVIILLLSCKQGTIITQSSRVQPSPVSQNSSVSEDKILFLQFGMVYDSIKQKDSIYLKDIKVRPGKLKEKETTIIENKIPGKLLCIFKDKNDNLIFIKMIDNPLHLNLETMDEKNQLFRREINLSKSEFTIRCKFNNSIHSVEFNQINKNGNLDLLTSIQLNINEP